MDLISDHFNLFINISKKAANMDYSLVFLQQQTDSGFYSNFIMDVTVPFHVCWNV
jgi:hypothetical protein